jgi:sialic acid synthase SpsE
MPSLGSIFGCHFGLSDHVLGVEFTYENLKSIKPGNGLAVEFFDDFLGKKAVVAIDARTLHSWGHLRILSHKQ